MYVAGERKPINSDDLADFTEFLETLPDEWLFILITDGNRRSRSFSDLPGYEGSPFDIGDEIEF